VLAPDEKLASPLPLTLPLELPPGPPPVAPPTTPAVAALVLPLAVALKLPLLKLEGLPRVEPLDGITAALPDALPVPSLWAW
jgi:hypothetical protein